MIFRLPIQINVLQTIIFSANILSVGIKIDDNSAEWFNEVWLMVFFCDKLNNE